MDQRLGEGEYEVRVNLRPSEDEYQCEVRVDLRLAEDEYEVI